MTTRKEPVESGQPGTARATAQPVTSNSDTLNNLTQDALQSMRKQALLEVRTTTASKETWTALRTMTEKCFTNADELEAHILSMRDTHRDNMVVAGKIPLGSPITKAPGDSTFRRIQAVLKGALEHGVSTKGMARNALETAVKAAKAATPEGQAKAKEADEQKARDAQPVTVAAYVAKGGEAFGLAAMAAEVARQQAAQAQAVATKVSA